MDWYGCYNLIIAMAKTCPNNRPSVDPEKLDPLEAGEYRTTGRVRCEGCAVSLMLGRTCFELKSGALSRGNKHGLKQAR